jgi:Mrp family chromosome partitioning ATPase
MVGVGRQPDWSGQDEALRARSIEVAAQLTIAPGDPRLSVVAAEVSRRAAAFRVLRHKLVNRGDPRVILVTSALDGDGKTTVAVNLAAALAESGQARVLLMEADVRRSALARILGIAALTCLFEQVEAWRDNQVVRWSVVEILPSGFHLLAIDPSHQDRHALHGPTFTKVVAEQRRLYDYVIIDAPSVLTGIEVNLVEDGVDGILFAGRAHESRGHILRRAVEQVSPGKVLGIVLVDT